MVRYLQSFFLAATVFLAVAIFLGATFRPVFGMTIDAPLLFWLSFGAWGWCSLAIDAARRRKARRFLAGEEEWR